MNTINLKDKFNLISEHYKPCIIGEVNDCLVKAVKFKGEFLCIITITKTNSFSS